MRKPFIARWKKQGQVFSTRPGARILRGARPSGENFGVWRVETVLKPAFLRVGLSAAVAPLKTENSALLACAASHLALPPWS